MEFPRDPIAAVTHPDPYPYYAELVAQRPFHRDSQLGLWVAASAAAVEAVLTSPLVRVRPPEEPVPAAIRGGPAGTLFGRLVRQNDDPRHGKLKPGITSALTALDPATVSRVAADCAARLIDQFNPVRTPAGITQFAGHLPVCAIASLLGFDSRREMQIASRVADLAAAFAPGAVPATVATGHLAASALMDELRVHLARHDPAALLPVGDALPSTGAPTGTSSAELRIANTVGLLTQSYEATAALIGNTLLALAARPAAAQHARDTPGALGPFVEEVARYDSPVQNTRRFMGESGVVCGQRLEAGEAVVVVLGAANRDPRVNSDPDRFVPERTGRRSYTFGVGPHRCPGMTLAVSIAQAGVAELVSAGLDLSGMASNWSYRPSGNIRLPQFGAVDAPH